MQPCPIDVCHKLRDNEVKLPIKSLTECRMPEKKKETWIQIIFYCRHFFKTHCVHFLKQLFEFWEHSLAILLSAKSYLFRNTKSFPTTSMELVLQILKLSGLVGNLRAHTLELRSKFGNAIQWRRLGEYHWCFRFAVWWKGVLRSSWKPLLRLGSLIGMILFWHFRPWSVRGDQVSKYFLSPSDLKTASQMTPDLTALIYAASCWGLVTRATFFFYEASQVARILWYSRITITNYLLLQLHLIVVQCVVVCVFVNLWC